MKQYFAKSLLLPLLAVILLSCILVLIPSEAYADEVTVARDMTPQQFQNYKPVIENIQLSRNADKKLYLMEENWKTYHVVTLKNPMQGAFLEYYGSDTKNGTYKRLANEQPLGSNDWIPKWDDKKYEGTYIKVRYCYRFDGDYTDYYTQYSEPFKAPADTPREPSLEMYRQTGKIYVNFPKLDGLSRSLQIREKGTSKWVSVSKSKLVKKVDITNGGYTLTLNMNKSYEVRGRQYVTINGEKVYSDYRTAKTFSNPSKVTDIQFLRYDKTDGIAILWNGTGSAQIAYRKAGSADSWKKITIDSSESKYASVGPYSGLQWWAAKLGYEYKIRPFTIVAGKKFYGYYSKVFTCNKKTAAFVNEINPEYAKVYFSDWETAETERPSYNHSLSIKENFRVIKKFASANLLVLFDHGYAGSNYEDFCDPYVDYQSRASEGLVGLRIAGATKYNQASMALELLRFYAGDDEVANALFCWARSVNNFGHANSDYFGFRDVKETKNGFIIEMNGQEIIVEYNQNGTIYWFDVN